MNPYDILQVTSQASDEEIKKKYRTLAQQNHPDKGGDAEKFKQINLAYSILSDSVRRKHFDTTGQYNINPGLNEEALTNLSRILNHFMNQINPELEDLIMVMKNDINREKKFLNEQITNCINAITKLERFLKKIKRKKEGENILKSFVQVQITSQENSIKSLNRNLEVCDKMLEILEDYEFGEIEWDLLINSISNQEAPAQ